MNEQAAAQTRGDVERIIGELQSLKIRPWNLHRSIRKLLMVEVGLLKVCGELLVAKGGLVDSIELGALASVTLDQKIKKLWERIYKAEEEYRKKTSDLEGEVVVLKDEIDRLKGGG